MKELLENELGVHVVERDIDRTELYIADEAFICGTGAEIRIINSIDKYTIGDGKSAPISANLEQLYHNVVRGKDTRYPEWRTSVY